MLGELKGDWKQKLREGKILTSKFNYHESNSHWTWMFGGPDGFYRADALTFLKGDPGFFTDANRCNLEPPTALEGKTKILPIDQYINSNETSIGLRFYTKSEINQVRIPIRSLLY